MRDRDSIAWNVTQIRTMMNEFEGKYLPTYMVGAIEGYCNNIERIAKPKPPADIHLIRADGKK
jgi:hypothetical protein